MSLCTEGKACQENNFITWQSCNAKSYEGACGKFRPFTQAAGLPCKLRTKLMLANKVQ